MLRFTHRVGKSYVFLSTLVSTIIIVLILSVHFTQSFKAMRGIGWQLFTFRWQPAEQFYGILPMLFGTLSVAMIAILIAVPLGVLTAIFTAETLPGRYRYYVKSLLELLAGIPSIIYGLIGVAFFSVWIGDWFDLQTGRTILTAGVLLAIMILPTIITLSDDAIHDVPEKYKDAARGLGLYHYEVIKTTVLPMAKPGIIGAVLLGIGRALGETMAVMLVIGGIDKIPDPVYNVLVPGQTITSKLGRSITETAFGSIHFSAMIFMGLVLLAIVLLLTLSAQQIFKYEPRLQK